MTCSKVGCQRADDDLERSTIGGIVVIACREHSTHLRLDGHIHQLFREQQRQARVLGIYIDALKGPAADPKECERRLDVLMTAERELQDAVESWFNIAGADRPS